MTHLVLALAALAAAPAVAGPAMDDLRTAAHNAQSGGLAKTYDNVQEVYPAAYELVYVRPVEERPEGSPYAWTPPPRPEVVEKEKKHNNKVKRAVDGVQGLSSASGLMGALTTIPLFGAVIGPAAYAVGAVVAVAVSAVIVQSTYSLYKLVF